MLKASSIKQVEKKYAKEAETKRKKESAAHDRNRLAQEKRAREEGLPEALKKIEKEIKKCIRREGEYTYHSERNITFSCGENHYGEYLGNLLGEELGKLGYNILWKPHFCEADWSDPDAPGHDSCWIYEIVVSWK